MTTSWPNPFSVQDFSVSACPQDFALPRTPITAYDTAQRRCGSLFWPPGQGDRVTGRKSRVTVTVTAGVTALSPAKSGSYRIAVTRKREVASRAYDRTCAHAPAITHARKYENTVTLLPRDTYLFVCKGKFAVTVAVTLAKSTVTALPQACKLLKFLEKGEF